MRPGVVGDHAQAGFQHVLCLEPEVEPMIVRVAVAAAVVDAGVLFVDPRVERPIERLAQISLA